jgi:hypothetical protein
MAWEDSSFIMHFALTPTNIVPKNASVIKPNNLYSMHLSVQPFSVAGLFVIEL